MKTSILTRIAATAAASVTVAAVALGAAISPAAADTGTIDYTVDASAPEITTRLDGSSNPCSDGFRRAGSFKYRVATLTVSQSGNYDFRDRFKFAAFDSPEQDGSTPGYGKGFFAIYGPNGDPAANTTQDCIATINYYPLSTYLEAGTTYKVLLTTGNPGEFGQFGYHYSGPGTMTLSTDGVSFEQAQAACVPGAAVPEGYTLKQGTAANETVRGTEGNDVIRGLGGNDTLLGLGGDDILCGGAGNDTLRGGDGADFLFGEAGNDGSYGDAGDDVIAGGLGNDLLNGGADTDTGLDTQGSNTFTSIESRTLEPAPTPQPTATANR